MFKAFDSSTEPAEIPAIGQHLKTLTQMYQQLESQNTNGEEAGRSVTQNTNGGDQAGQRRTAIEHKDDDLVDSDNESDEEGDDEGDDEGDFLMQL